MNNRLWQRFLYQPCLPLGENGTRVTSSARHIALSRRAASEGMVLLKNEENTLPLPKGSKIALFGKGTVDYVKGGGGSGDVTVEYCRNLYQGFLIKESEGKVKVFQELASFYEDEVKRQYENGAVPGMTEEPDVPEDLFERAAAYADTAIVSFSRFSGEGWDRESKPIPEGYPTGDDEIHLTELSNRIFPKGDYYLTDLEQRLLNKVQERFSHVVVVLNVGGMVDVSWFVDNPKIQAALMAFQGGMEGGLAEADVLCGDVTPSGRLTDTYARKLSDYPSTEGFHESMDYVDYTEDIYVGYRYFETIPNAAEKVIYPFGYGLSYTDFAMEVKKAYVEEDQISFYVWVKNIGNRSGKQVVQIYVNKPQGKLGKPAKELIAFDKTKELLPGQYEILKISVKISALSSFDDTGKVQDAAWVMEKGTYGFFVGENVRDAKETNFTYSVEEDRILDQVAHRCIPHKLDRRLRADGSFESLTVSEYSEETAGLDRGDKYSYDGIEPTAIKQKMRYMDQVEEDETVLLRAVYEHQIDLDSYVQRLTVEEKIALLGGQPNTGVANCFGIGNNRDHGIPNICTADGPAGLRIKAECGVCATAWPCATLLASTWNVEMVEEVGKAGALEVKENNLGVWLTPAVNIHRSPLCGRNFEYYSEDPLLAGKMGAAMVRGIQSQKIAASVKHFACNNKETNRKDSDSRLSERALREIYLKPFEYIVREADPWTIMSSYNMINGIHASENRELLTGILRDEWHFQGIVTTDWWTFGEHYREINAGNDLKMGCGFPERVREAYEKGYILEQEMNVSVKRVLELILKLA